MGRHRIEDQFKEKLAQREITPTAGSWEKLSGKLNSQEKKKGFSLWWIGIAATFLGAIFIAGLVYNNSGEIVNPGIVETPVEEINNTENLVKPVESTEILSEGIANENTTVQEKTSTGFKEKNTNSAPTSDALVIENFDSTINSKANSNKQIASTIPPESNEEIFNQEVSNAVGNDLTIASEMNNILAEIAQLEKNTGKVENAEIDSLLSKAATQISKNRQERFASEKIDAEALLWDVEMDMEASFREKIFEVMKEGYLKARTAVANRNN